MTTRVARIDRFTSRIEADLARGLLESAGIAAWVSADDAGGNNPALPFGIGGTVVVVAEDDLADALAILDATAP